MKKFEFTKKLITIRALIVIVALVAANFFFLPRAFASTLTHSTVMEIAGGGGAMIAGATNEVVLDFTTVGSGATTASVNFNNFTGGTVATTSLTIASTGCANYFPSATLLPGGSLAATGSGNIVSITGITSLTATTNYCTILTKTTQLTNPSTPGVYSALLTVGSDSQTDAFDVLSSSGTPNSYTVTGTVAPTFTMSLNNATDNFASNLSSSSIAVSPGVTATINTNALTGWFLWAEDANAGLHSTQASKTIATVSTGSNANMTTDEGTEAYALAVTSGGTSYNTPNYAYNSGTTGGGLSSSQYEEIATNNAPANGVAQVIHELADISPTTPPATDYGDTITIIGAGSF